MSMTIRESDVDVDEIRSKLTPKRLDEALEHLDSVMLALWPLRRGYQEGCSPEVLRALFLVQCALEDAANSMQT